MGQNKTIHLKDLLLISAFILLAIVVSYKFFEWNLLKNISTLQSTAITKELSILEKSNKLNNSSFEKITELYSEKTKQDQKKVLYDDLDGLLSLTVDNDKSYKDIIEKNQKEYSKYKLLVKIIIGERGKIVQNIVNSQLQYYEFELESISDSISSDYLIKNIFSVGEDKEIMTSYDVKVSKSPTKLYSEYFNEIASLEKYTRDDFKFDYEDTIKDKSPYGYETLKNNQEYMSSYYSVVKDYVSGDYDSANYKYSKLQEQYLKLNIDMDKLFSENIDSQQERSKKVIELIAKKDLSIKTFKEKSFGKYPFGGFIAGWKEDLELCQIYLVKGGLLSSISGNPIKAVTFDEYLKELSQISPDTSELDTKFDRSVVRYDNSDNKITYSCKDTESGKEFIYINDNQ